jgi:blpT protein
VKNEFVSFLVSSERKVILMGAGDFIQEALLTIQAIEDSFLAYSQTIPDAVRFQENLDYILRYLKEVERVDNRVLMELEKFYQRASFLIGLSALHLDEATFQAWRVYDRFHYDRVKSQLQVYGPTVVL